MAERVGASITASGMAHPSPCLVPKARYVSPAFAKLEAERLWPRAWQIACSVDHVAEPGDFFTLRSGPYSVIVVRGEDGVLRAFQNVCRHRGNEICQGSGSGLRELRCPYHRWSWSLEGRLNGMPSRAGFGAFRNEEFPLFPASVGTWGRLVFVNLDPAAEPLEAWLEGVPADAAEAGLDEFRCVATLTVPLDANWKVIADGFSETYHVQGLHREMLGSMDDIDAPQKLWSRHGVSYQDYGVPSPRLGANVSDQTVWDSWITTQGGRMGPDYVEACPVPPLPPGATVRDLIAEKIRAHHAKTFGCDLAGIDARRMLRLAQYNLFPNATVLVWGEMLNVLLARPGPAPDRGEFVAFLLYRMAPGAPRTRPFDAPPNADADLGFVIGQDVSVARSVQRGLAQPGLTHLALSNEECRIIHMHRNLERFLGIGPADPA